MYLLFVVILLSSLDQSQESRNSSVGLDFVVVIRSEPVQGAESLSILIRATLVTFFPILGAFKCVVSNKFFRSQ